MLFTISACSLSAQYVESFSTPNKGILAGPCGPSVATCAAIDFGGEDWTVTGNFSGFDDDDIFATNTSGVLFIGGDIDEEMCYESPELDIVGSTSFTVDLEWNHHDNSDYIDVEYMVDGSGTWIQIPNQFGGQTHTVDFPGSGTTGSGTVTSITITGVTIKVRVCVDSNTSSSGESTTVDNLNVMGAVLPVTWSTVDVSSGKEGNVIKWTTLTETNNDYFEIQKRSEEQEDFETIGMIEGQGNSIQAVDYRFIDDGFTSAGRYCYYRIKQVDLDGQHNYSKVVSIKLDADNSLSIFPNPFSDAIQISTRSVVDQEFTVAVHDVFGKVVLRENFQQNSNSKSIDTNEVPAGIYYMTNTLDGTTQVFVKK